MDTIAFIIALGVGVAVVAWYAFNEAKGGAGALGILAIKDDGEGEAGEAPADAVRYRARERARPAGRMSAGPAPPTKAYREKPSRAARRGPADGSAETDPESDKEY